MATYEQVHADITHIHTMLEEQKKNLPEGHNMTSAIANQAAGVLQMLRNLTGLNHEQSMQMQRLVLAGPWTGQQKGEFAHQPPLNWSFEQQPSAPACRKLLSIPHLGGCAKAE